MPAHYWVNKPFSETLEKCKVAAFAANVTHANSIELAAKAIDSLKDGETVSCVMVGEPQSGKTAAQIISILGLPIIWPTAKKIGVLFITNKSLTAIFKQTKDRLEGAGFSQEPFSDDCTETLWKKKSFDSEIWLEPIIISGVCWDDSSNSGKFKTAREKLNAAGCTHFAIVMDEVHIAVKTGQQVDRFLKGHLGIQVPTSKTKTFIPPTVFIGSTATPHRDFIAPKFSETLAIVYGKPGKSYYGMENLRTRMHHVSELSEDALYEVLSPLNKTLNNKLFVIRINAYKRSSPEDSMVHAVAQKLGLKVLSFSSSPDDRNLQHLPNRFKSAPQSGNMIVIIKQGLGAGAAISTVEHIGVWVDTAFRNTQSLVQSLGRLCGNQENRHRAVFPIYCDTSEVDKYIHRMKATAEGRDLDDAERAGILRCTLD